MKPRTAMPLLYTAVEGRRSGLPLFDGIFLLGTDLLGRDLWSRLIVATQVSLTIGLLGVTVSLFLGVLLGGVSAIYGGMVDLVIQRAIEVIREFSDLAVGPLLMRIHQELRTTRGAAVGLMKVDDSGTGEFCGIGNIEVQFELRPHRVGMLLGGGSRGSLLVSPGA